MSPDSALAAVILGAVQGVTEWIPVSSDGAIATTSRYLFGSSLSEGVRMAFWLHLGTALAATIYFRSAIWRLLRELVSRRGRLTPEMWFLGLATVVGGLVALPLLVYLDQFSAALGGSAMFLVGIMLIATGLVQLRRREPGTRDRTQVTTVDGVMVGIAQGLSALPGLSRSAGTIGVMLARRISGGEALSLSFLMSIPASVAAALYAGIDGGLFVSGSALLGVAVAAAVGLVTLRLLLAAATRINFGKFVLIAGVAVILAAFFEWVV
ncbi:MAG: undecaprenyl-diphosphate phosphatase [SAR202 cluster bacterium]|nr:undecaprenyl-diphosphate phosphatase [SAR202 cluster bacterium]